MVTQISLLLLLFGTIVGDFALISDVSARAFKGLAAPSSPPAWLVAYDGRGTMCLFAVVAVFPLCCLKGMRQVGNRLLQHTLQQNICNVMRYSKDEAKMLMICVKQHSLGTVGTSLSCLVYALWLRTTIHGLPK